MLATQNCLPPKTETGNIRALALWIGLGSLLCITAYGFGESHVFHEQIWLPAGWRRLELLAAVFACWFLVFFRLRPRWFVPVTLGVALLYTGAGVGPLAALAVLFFLFSAYVLGKAITGESANGVVALLLGWSVYIWIVQFAVRWPVNYPAVYIAMLAIPIVWKRHVAAASLRQCIDLVRPAYPGPWRDQLALALLVFVLVAHWLITLKPEIGADALAMHLAIPASVAAHHQFIFDFKHTTWALMPMGSDWGYTIVYMLGGEYAARLLNLSALLAVVGLLWFVIRRWLSRPAALLLMATFAATPLVQLVTGSLFSENIWAALLLAALVELWQFHETGHKRDLYALAILLGSAIAVKFGALAFAASVIPLAGIELFRKRKGGIAAPAAIALALLLLFGSFPYVYAYVKSGNPVFPFKNTVFKSPYYDSKTAWRDYNHPPGHLRLETLYDMTFHSEKYVEGRGGSLGFQYLALLPLCLALVGRKWKYEGWTTLLIILITAELSFRAQTNLRYLYPLLPLCTMLIALTAALARSLNRELYRAVLLAALAALLLDIRFLPAAGFWHSDFVLDPVFHKKEINDYLMQSADVRLIVEYLNRAHTGEPAVFAGTSQIAGLFGQAFTTGWHNDVFCRRIAAANSSEDFLQLANDYRLRFFIVPKPGDAFWGNMPAFDAFVRQYTIAEYATGGPHYLARLREDSNRMDAVQYFTTSEKSFPASPEWLKHPVARGLYDDFNPAIVFTAVWTHDRRFSDAMHGTISYSNDDGAAFRLRFTGSEITYVHTRAFNRGIAEVLIDGKSVGKIDLYTPGVEWQARTAFRGLSGGQHTFEVRRLAGHNSKAQAGFIDLDELIVR